MENRWKAGVVKISQWDQLHSDATQIHPSFDDTDDKGRDVLFTSMSLLRIRLVS